LIEDRIFAKSKPVETIPEHTKNVLKQYEFLKAEKYLNKDLVQKYDEVIKKIISYHDLGKMNSRFQNRIRKAIGVKKVSVSKELNDYSEIPHEWLSLSFISKEDRKFFKSFDSSPVYFNDLVKYCIAFHHTRDRMRYDFEKESYKKTVKFDLEPNKKKIEFSGKLKNNINLDQIKMHIDENFKDYLCLLVFFKGILHKCDYSASAGINPEQTYLGNYQNDFKNWLCKKSITLRDYQNNALALSDKNIVFIASTGAGKTEYSMNWINGDKAFYLLGLKMAVNKIYDRFKNIFEDKNIALLHGDVKYFIENEGVKKENYFDKINKARQLSYPITIATADQLVTSVFKYNSFELVYLIASYSKIIVDEIQSFSPESIAAIVVFLQEIHSLGGKFLLMTATLPPFVKDEFTNLSNVEFPPAFLTPIKRHKIEMVNSDIEYINKEKIENLLEKNNKILIICNTVKKTQLLYDILKNFSPNLLHAGFIIRDRRSKEEKIMKDAPSKEEHKKSTASLWISTQVVEASLDIDFDYLFTECSTVDSLFQRFGRCFRLREYKNDDANIYIYESDNISKKIYDPEISENTWKILSEYNNRLISEEEKQLVIEKVFADISETKYYQSYLRYKKLLQLGYRAANKNEAQYLFRKIANNYAVIPEPVYNENKQKIDALIKNLEMNANDFFIEKINTKRKLFEYTMPVQLYRKKQGLLREFCNSKFCKNNRIYLLKGVDYSFEKGLTFKKNYTDYDNFIM